MHDSCASEPSDGSVSEPKEDSLTTPRSAFEISHGAASLSLETRDRRGAPTIPSFAQMTPILEDPNLSLATSTRAALARAAQAIREGTLSNNDGSVVTHVKASRAAQWLADDIGVVAMAQVWFSLDISFRMSIHVPDPGA